MSMTRMMPNRAAGGAPRPLAGEVLFSCWELDDEVVDGPQLVSDRSVIRFLSLSFAMGKRHGHRWFVRTGCRGHPGGASRSPPGVPRDHGVVAVRRVPLRQGGTPSSSISREKLRNVLTQTMMRWNVTRIPLVSRLVPVAATHDHGAKPASASGPSYGHRVAINRPSAQDLSAPARQPTAFRDAVRGAILIASRGWRRRRHARQELRSTFRQWLPDPTPTPGPSCRSPIAPTPARSCTTPRTPTSVPADPAAAAAGGRPERPDHPHR